LQRRIGCEFTCAALNPFGRQLVIGIDEREDFSLSDFYAPIAESTDPQSRMDEDLRSCGAGHVGRVVARTVVDHDHFEALGRIGLPRE
jgi:hypothetical protein